jgi:putative transposase
MSIPRSSAYYQTTSDTSRDGMLMRAMDEIHLRLPFYGSRRISDELMEEGHLVNRKCVQRLMRQTGMNTLYPKPNTSRAHHAHKVYLYAYDSISQAREGIRRWMHFYNHRRKHQALENVRRIPSTTST